MWYIIPWLGNLAYLAEASYRLQLSHYKRYWKLFTISRVCHLINFNHIFFSLKEENHSDFTKLLWFILSLCVQYLVKFILFRATSANDKSTLGQLSRYIPTQLTTRKQSMGIGLALLIFFSVDSLLFIGFRDADPYFLHHLLARLCFGCGQQLLENVIDENDDGKAANTSNKKESRSNNYNGQRGKSSLPERVDHYDV